jgi:hypothetical protein
MANVLTTMTPASTTTLPDIGLAMSLVTAPPMCSKGKRRARMYWYQRVNVLKLYLPLSTGTLVYTVCYGQESRVLFVVGQLCSTVRQSVLKC